MLGVCGQVCWFVIFVRGVKDDLSITEELLDVAAMKGTPMKEDIFEVVEKSTTKLNYLGKSWWG